MKGVEITVDDLHKNFREFGNKSKSRPTIGLLLENTVNRSGYQVDVWSGVADALRDRANLISFAGGTLGNSDSSEAENMQNIAYDLASINNVDGLIISGTLGSFVDAEEFQNFIKRFEPLPMVSTIVSFPGIPSVMVDNKKGMRDMLNHLITEHPYRKIGFIRGPENNPDAEERYQVYKDVLAEHGIPFDESLVVSGDFKLSSGVSALDYLLSVEKREPDVLIAGNDNMALGVLDALRGWGIRVPEDLAVVGFDDMVGARDVTPSLTTVYYPAYEQGKQAAEMLLDLLFGKENIEPEILSTKLKLRESCGCPDPTIEQAKAGLTSKASARSGLALDTSRGAILDDIRKRVLVDIEIIGDAQTQELLSAFYAELQGRVPEKGFLAVLDEILRIVAFADGNVSDWHVAISTMRQNILPLISEDSMLFHAEDLWQQARVMVGKRSRRAEGYKRLQAEQRNRKMNELAQELGTTSDLNDWLAILANGLKYLGIYGCYLSTYENPSAPTEWCRLVLAYNAQKGSIKLPSEGQIFPAHQIVPPDILNHENPYNLIVEPLYYRKNQLGIVVFEFDAESMESSYKGEIYETFRGQIINGFLRVYLTKYLQSLSEASTYVMSIQEPDEILQAAADQACKTVRAFSVQIVLVNQNNVFKRLISGGNSRKSLTEPHLVGQFARECMRKRVSNFISNTNNSNDMEIRQIAKAGFGAAGCFPLFLRDKSIGILWIFYENPYHFPHSGVSALNVYVNQIAIAYDNAKRMKELEHLQQASQELASVGDVRDVLKQIVTSAHEVLQADSIAIWSYDAIQQTFLPDELVTQGIPEELVEKSKLDQPSHGGTAETVIQKGYLAVNDVNDVEYTDFLGPQAHRLRGEIGVRSFLGIALKVDDEALGVLYVNYKTSHGFDDDIEATLKVFAHYATLALKKARLLKQVRRAYDTATVVAEVSVQEDLQSTLKAIVEGTRDAFRCDAVTLNSYNPVINDLDYPPTISGVNHPELVQRLKRGEDSIVHKMLLQKEPCIVDDTSENVDFKDRRFVKDEGIKSCVAIPLAVAAQKAGVMFVNYRTRHHFTGQEINDIKLFAYQAAVAIRNAQLYEDATRKTKYLQAMYEAEKAVTSTLALDEILTQIVKQASKLTENTKGEQAQFCYLALKENSILKLKASYTSSHVPNVNINEPMNEQIYTIDLEGSEQIWIVGQVVKTGKSQLVDDVIKHPDYILFNKGTHSLLAVPIRIGSDIVGAIVVEHSDYGAFGEEDRVCLESLSTQAGLAMRNAQLYDEAKRKAQRLQSLYQAGKMVTSTLALDEILRLIVEQASLLTMHEGERAHFCHLALHQDRKLKFKAVYPPDYKSKITDETYKIDLEHDERIGIVGRAVKTGKSCLVPDVRKDTDYIVGNSKTLSELAVPIIIGDDVVGVIAVEHSSLNAFDDDDLNFLESLSTQAALAIRNAQLYDKATKEARHLQALYEAGAAVTSTFSFSQILERIVKQVRLITGSDGAPAYLVHLGMLEGAKLNISVWRSDRSDGPQDVKSIDLEKDFPIGIMGRAAKRGESILQKDVTLDDDYLMYDSETCSELAVPIKLGEKVIGVINVEHPDYGIFNEADQKSLEALAGYVAIAIQNAKAYDDLKRAQGLIAGRTALAWMGMASSAWRHSADKFALTIRETAQLLRRDGEENEWLSQNKRAGERIAKIEELATHILEKPITPPLSNESGLEDVSVTALIRERARQLWSNAPYNTIRLETNYQLPESSIVLASPEWLRRAFDMLVDNAVKAISDREQRIITIGTYNTIRGLEIWVSDTGSGIPKEIVEKIGLDMIEKPADAEGLGMGLLIAQTIIQTYGGNIIVESTSPAGTTMVILLPLNEKKYVAAK